ncbi:MAG: hypothetical protein JSR90_10300 [Proteobacteria bacterium]|nr:hypothetical protein [Pseudomonadota bacterium]
MTDSRILGATHDATTSGSRANDDAGRPFRVAGGRHAGGYWIDIPTLLIAGGAFFIGVILWLDNAQGGLTGNGIMKAKQLTPWIIDPAHAPLDPSNYLFFPAYGALCRVLDLLGLWAGDPRRQIALLNALSASLCLCVVYLLVRHITGRRILALLAALFHLACYDVLVLAVINEDIMSSYTVMFSSMALAAIWFARPTALRVCVVAAIFTIGWLFEWRLMFPTLPAMLAALWLCEKRPTIRVAWIALFAGAMLATTAVVALAWHGHAGAVGVTGLLWTGKGVGSSWGGFTWPKVVYLFDGMTGYLLGAGMITIADFPGGWDVWRITGLTMIVAAAAASIAILWRARSSTQAWALAAVFGGTFLAGEVMNFYSQPQDPQMQINVMGWLTLGAALIAGDIWRRRGPAGPRLLAAVSIALLANSLWSLTPVRGADTNWRLAVERIKKVADPTRTVFLLHDFEWSSSYFRSLGATPEPGIADLAAAPTPSPPIRWIGLIATLLRHPDWSPDKHAEALKAEIERARSLGYDVVTVRVWTDTLPELLSETGMVADADRIGALYRVLHDSFVGVRLLDDATAGSVYRLEPKDRAGK